MVRHLLTSYWRPRPTPGRHALIETPAPTALIVTAKGITPYYGSDPADEADAAALEVTA